MNNFLGKFRKKPDNNVFFNNNHEKRDSITTDHVVIPQATGKKPVKSDLGNGVENDEQIRVKKYSQLAFSLNRLLLDSSALSYFIQFLEATDKLNLIKFWMHVEGFKASFSDGNQAAQELSLLDAKNIYEKYIDSESKSSIAVPKRIKTFVEENMARKPLYFDCFDPAQEFVRQLFELRYFEEFQNSIYYKKHELGVLSEGCSILDVLKVQPLLQSFIEFVKEKEDQDMVQFLVACDTYESNVETLEDNEALDDAMALYEKYFSMQATNAIDLGPSLRAELESMICDESGRPHSKTFSTPRTACFCRLHDKYMVDFVRSPAYSGYLNEISTQIETTVELPRANRPRRTTSSNSDAQSSSADSLTSAFNKHIETLEQKRIELDNRTPVNSPRSQRSTPRSSRLAEVDELGRYHALYDDTHSYSGTQKTPSRIKSTLRKYLDKTALKEEEIAEEVARSIILDMQKLVASADSPR